MHCVKRDTNFNIPISVPFTIVVITPCQVLGRTSPFPLILLPQFGGYWIEGTNHEPKDAPEADQPPGSASHIKLETNSTAKIYRKQFMGKVRMGKKGQRKSCLSWLDILNNRRSVSVEHSPWHAQIWTYQCFVSRRHFLLVEYDTDCTDDTGLTLPSEI